MEILKACILSNWVKKLLIVKLWLPAAPRSLPSLISVISTDIMYNNIYRVLFMVMSGRSCQCRGFSGSIFCQVPWFSATVYVPYRCCRMVVQCGLRSAAIEVESLIRCIWLFTSKDMVLIGSEVLHGHAVQSAYLSSTTHKRSFISYIMSNWTICTFICISAIIWPYFVK